MNSSYEVLNFIIELKNDYEVKKVLIETKIQELNRELQDLIDQKTTLQKNELESSSVFSPYCDNSQELSRLNQLLETKEREIVHKKNEQLEVVQKQGHIQQLQKVLTEWINEECERCERSKQIQVQKNHQILKALDFNKQIDHSIAVQLKSISGDLDSLFGALHNTKQYKKPMDLLKRDIKQLENLSDYLYAGITDSVGVVEAINQFIQQKTKNRAVHIIFTYEGQVEQADITKKYFIKQIIHYLYGIFETINHLSKMELHLRYESEQYHLMVKVDSFSSDTVETYPVINQLVQLYDGRFFIESNEYVTQFHIHL